MGVILYLRRRAAVTAKVWGLPFVIYLKNHIILSSFILADSSFHISVNAVATHQTHCEDTL